MIFYQVNVFLSALIKPFSMASAGLERWEQRRDPLHAGGIILDDAHVSFSTVRDYLFPRESKRKVMRKPTNTLRISFAMILS